VIDINWNSLVVPQFQSDFFICVQVKQNVSMSGMNVEEEFKGYYLSI